MVFPAFGRRDGDVIAAGARHLPRLLEGGLCRLPAVDQIAVLTHRSDRKAHFLFFFLFFLMISAWTRKACASARIWPATTASAVFIATRSAVAACCRMALVIFMPVNFPAVPRFRFGRDDKPFYVPGPHDNAPLIRRRIEQLQPHLGDDGLGRESAA